MMEEAKRYTVPQRIFHWVNAVSVFVLLISGLAIYSPNFFASVNIPTSTWFKLHMWFTPIFLAGIAFHIIHATFFLDRLGNLWFGRAEQRRSTIIIRNFFGITREYPKLGKYHPAQILVHWAFVANLLVLTLTGFILWKPLRYLIPFRLFGFGWDFIFFNRILHDLFTASLASLVIGHFYFAVFIKKNWAELKAMFTGTIPLEEYKRYHEIESE
jgi:formate dehydrogenase subunit gamma